MISTFKIRAAREQVGLTQSELAEKMQISRATVNRWETGLVAIPQRRWVKLLETLCILEKDIVLLAEHKEVFVQKNDSLYLNGLMKTPYVPLDLQMKFVKDWTSSQRLKFKDEFKKGVTDVKDAWINFVVYKQSGEVPTSAYSQTYWDAVFLNHDSCVEERIFLLDWSMKKFVVFTEDGYEMTDAGREFEKTYSYT